MSSSVKRPLREAMADAEAFRALFPASCYTRWEIAGSVRRRREYVGDVEHVVIPAIGEWSSGDIFATPTTGSLLWHELDKLVDAGTVKAHTYQTTRGDQFRWGEKYRGIDFRHFNHEIFCAMPDSWGSVLAIRTGPAELSKELVTRLLKYGYKNAEGCVWDTKTGAKVPVETEEKFWSLTGLPYVVPQQRDAQIGAGS